MKKLTLLFLLLPFFIYSQNYSLSAMFAERMFIKGDGSVHVGDSLFVMKMMHKGKETVLDFDIINERNGRVYLSDGVMRHYYTIIEKKGKKKGNPYTHEMYFTFDQEQGGQIVVYYLKLEE
ncbi:MAG: hypothetical protein WBG90_18405 [Saonia sp.]